LEESWKLIWDAQNIEKSSIYIYVAVPVSGIFFKKSAAAVAQPLGLYL
jgi:hypothetical protein